MDEDAAFAAAVLGDEPLFGLDNDLDFGMPMDDAWLAQDPAAWPVSQLPDVVDVGGPAAACLGLIGCRCTCHLTLHTPLHLTRTHATCFDPRRRACMTSTMISTCCWSACCRGNFLSPVPQHTPSHPSNLMTTHSITQLTQPQPPFFLHAPISDEPVCTFAAPTAIFFFTLPSVMSQSALSQPQPPFFLNRAISDEPACLSDKAPSRLFHTFCPEQFLLNVAISDPVSLVRQSPSQSFTHSAQHLF